MVIKVELVFIPMPYMGHFLSMVQVAKLLVDLNSNLSITVFIMKISHDTELKAYIDSLTARTNSSTTSAARIKFINLPQPEADKDVTALDFVTTLLQTHVPLVKEAVTSIVHDSNSVPDSPRLAGFVLDLFLTPLIDLANDLNVPSYIFYASGAAFLGFQFHTLVLHGEQNVNFVELKNSDTEFSIPSYLNPVSSKVFPSVMLEPESLPIVINLVRKLREAKGIMINTFSELESHAVDSLSNGKNPPVYPVGPILNLERESVVHKSCDIMTWLDEQPPSSVVYLSFGSQGSFDGDQVKEIACALEQSGYRFLWSLRRPQNTSNGMTEVVTEYNDLAEGFLDRTASIGKIIGWAPQVAILGHPAVGGFVSHCGWNSTLESIWFGVPMAAWPLYAEQQMNAFQLVTELGLAVEIKMDYRKVDVKIVRAEKIEKAINCLMEQDSDVRKRVKEMSQKSRKTLTDNGSSHSTLCAFINDVMDNMTGKY